MVTIFDKAGEMLSYRIANIVPIWFLLLIVGIIIFFYLIATRRPHRKEYKPIDMKKEIKNDLDVQYKYFSSLVQKPLYNAMTKIGVIAGYMPLLWQERKYYKLIQRKIRGEIKTIEIKVSENDLQRTTSKIRIEDTPIELVALKIYQTGIFSKVKAMFGFGLKYFIFDKKDINTDVDSIKINPDLQRQYFFGQFIFSKAGKNTIDNTSFKVDRENQLQEIANQIPRTVFFANEFAQRAMAMREQAKIEAEKYSAQKESMQD